MSHWKIIAPLATLGLAISLVAAMPEGPSAGETATPAAASATSVRIDDFNFTPPALVVGPGTTVTWTNADDTPHNVREKDGKFKSAALDTIVCSYGAQRDLYDPQRCHYKKVFHRCSLRRGRAQT